MNKIGITDLLKQMEKNDRIFSASRDAIDHKSQDYLITVSFPFFKKMMYRDGFISTDVTMRRKWDVLVYSGIFRNSSENHAQLDMHAFNEALGIGTHTHTHTQPDAVKGGQE